MFPKLDLTEKFQYTIHTTGQVINCQSWTVGQESLMLAAFEYKYNDPIEELKRKQHVLRQICSECILTPDVDVSTWQDYEMEMFLIKAKTYTTGFDVNRNFVCEGTIKSTDAEGIQKDEPCGAVLDVNINLNDIQLKTYDDVQNIFDIGQNYYLKVREPKHFNANIDDTSDKTTVIESVLDELIYRQDGEETVYKFSEQSKEDIEYFVQKTLTPKIRHNVFENFISKLPHIQHDIVVECPVCSTKTKFKIRALNDVFQ